ncbi:hypothetical protein C7S17_0922 [Burkholderia thailandensis]|nr:hypothetical protein [Burkholderia thailandensis]
MPAAAGERAAEQREFRRVRLRCRKRGHAVRASGRQPAGWHDAKKRGGRTEERHDLSHCFDPNGPMVSSIDETRRGARAAGLIPVIAQRKR